MFGISKEIKKDFQDFETQINLINALETEPTSKKLEAVIKLLTQLGKALE